MGCMSFFQTFIIAANSCSLFEFQKWEASMKIFCFLLRVSSRQNDWGLNPLFVRLFVFLCFRAAFYFSVSTIFFFSLFVLSGLDSRFFCFASCLRKIVDFLQFDLFRPWRNN